MQLTKKCLKPQEGFMKRATIALLALMTASFIQLTSLTANATAQIAVKPATGGPAVMGSYNSYYFGRVWINMRTSARFTVTNVGNEPLEFQSANIWGSLDFSAYHNCRGTLQPHQMCSYEITYWPMFEGMADGQFELRFKQDSVITHVWGEAIK